MKKNTLHLLSVTLVDDKFCLKKGLHIDFKDVTLLVGEQGCGKSTLLEMLQKNKGIEVKLSDDVITNGINTFYFDSEKMNPRITDPQMYSTPSGVSVGIGVGGAIKSRFMSHGEVLREYTVNRIKDAKDCILFLDEPESALSLKNQYKLVKEIKKCAKNNVQLIISTHCLPIIESVEDVYSLEHKKWMTSKEFIEFSKK